MTKKEDARLICSRLWMSHTENSVQRNCDECGEPVWISVSGVQMMANTEQKYASVRITCTECVKKDAKTVLGLVLQNPVEGGLEEIRKEHGDEAISKIKAVTDLLQGIPLAELTPEVLELLFPSEPAK